MIATQQRKWGLSIDSYCMKMDVPFLGGILINLERHKTVGNSCAADITSDLVGRWPIH